ncbi:thiamine phosphate synthase [Solibacillus sp.]|uniref:thiamine phosphate synthase n=1 Tax=Solibacillus sp. TaxID=1909654 RepID=UPI0033162692
MSFNLDKYFIMGTINCHEKAPLVILEAALKAGVTMFQLREKGKGCLEGAAYLQFAKDCQKLCRQYKVPFIVNDDVELALALDADGIHVGQDDVGMVAFRKKCPEKIIGVSVHTLTQLNEAISNGADYVGIGPIFTTKSKVDVIQSSLQFLEAARKEHFKFPIVAIGGITTKNSHLVRQAGANGVAVISEIADSKAIFQTVKHL